MQVPLDRMNETMQRMTKLGGKIVSIHPLDAIAPSAESAPRKGKKSIDS